MDQFFFLSTGRSLDGDVCGGLSPWYQNFQSQQLHTCHYTYHIFSYLSPYSEICESCLLRSFWQHATTWSRTEQYCKQNLGPILGPRQNERLKVLFCFPENPHIIKLTINLIIVMIPFFKKILCNSLVFQIDHTVEWRLPFWSPTFTVFLFMPFYLHQIHSG